mgnify:CR=1 FL=1
MTISKQRNIIWLVLLLLVVCSNIALYKTNLYDLSGASNSSTVVLGSLFDLLIVTPVLLMLYFKKFSLKMAIAVLATGCIIARIAIPTELLAPYQFITTGGLIVEAAIIAFELTLLIGFFTYIPKIVAKVRTDERPAIFAYKSLIEQRTANRLVHILADELLVFYYAIFSWRKKREQGITLHKGSSYIALQVMILHAIVLESVGLHWWLHSKWPTLSIILLLLNIYGLLFILADLQVTRLYPIRTNDKGIYLNLGLMKHTYIAFDQIEDIIVDQETLQLKKQKDRSEFMCTDFEEVFPNFLLKMKAPHPVNYMYGFQKHFDYIAIKCDAPEQLLEVIRHHTN